MPRGNGNIIGPTNSPTDSVASGVWSLVEAQQAQENASWPLVFLEDLYFPYTTLLLHGDGTNGAQNNTFLDSSTNNFTITRNGNTTQGTFSPFSQDDGKWGAYFDGSGDYLDVANNAAFQFGTGNFTVEFFINTTDTAFNAISLTTASSGNWAIVITGGQFYWQTAYTSTNLFSTSSSGLTNGAWNHVAVVRNGSTTSVYFNGVSQTSATDNTNYAGTGTLRIGSGGNGDLLGYISNIRIVKGSAVYTSAFTPSTTPLTAISGTSLLTCQSNRFVDNSSNAFAITVNGNTSIQPFSPFAPSAAYSAATNGGSGYFDGSGDYLTVANNAALQFGTGDFTVEGWYYANTDLNSGYARCLFSVGSDSSGIMMRIYPHNDSLYVNGTSYNWNPSNFKLKLWNHVVLVRTSTTLSAFVNGSRVFTTSNSSNISQSTNTNIGTATHAPSEGPFDGWIHGFRIIKGSGPYDATQTTLTVPTAPLTAITNTSLLLNFTNAGILDNTGRNDLETVGNAQISTSVKKFGTGSLAFDGTGDYLLVPSSVNWDFGTGDFTVEFWINFTSVGNDTIIGKWGSGAGKYAWVVQVNSSNLIFYTGNNGSLGSQYTFSWSPGTSTWYHVAVTRSGTNLRAFVNGTQIGSTQTNSDSLSASGAFCCIGENLDGGGQSAFVQGYIDDLRITKGVARYTANFTPPTAAFEDQ